MTAANYNLTIDQGSDFAIQLTLSEDNSAKNLTGYAARAQMRSKKSDASSAADFTCTVVDAVLGKIKVSMANGTTSQLSPGIYYYDLELFTNEDGNVTRLIEGQVTVTQEVTR